EGVTRLKKYSELSVVEAIQADCDVKATNIILQGLPLEVYALVSTHKVAKELWERIQMLMEGTMILESVEQGPLIWPSVEVEGVTRLKKSSELSVAEAIQADCDVKTTNIILQGLPPEVYALVRTDTSSLVNHNAYMASSSAPQIAYAPMDQQSSEYSPPEAGLVVLNFVSAGSSRPFTSGQGGAPGKQRVITCYNCKGEGHMSKQCTKPRRKRDAEWFKDKVLLVQAQANREVLKEEELEFLADP
nr:retrovirus-related Pol polyprotein from transposon TNT 1-94 [Tanacetum cinerariifolium]